MFQLKTIANDLGAEYFGQEPEATSVSIDTRTLLSGALFVAIVGPHFDGHDFVSQAISQGAVAVMVNSRLNIDVPQLVVKDTTAALGEIASLHRKKFKIPVIGITGSCGKTGTKEMTASILSQMGPTLATAGNLNNQYGVPLTLLRLNHTHQSAVIEMGTSQPGEIEYLSTLVNPTLSLSTFL